MTYQCYHCGATTEMDESGPFLVKASAFEHVQNAPEMFNEDALFAVCDACAKQLGHAIAERASKIFPGLALGVLGAAIVEEQDDE